MELSFANTDTSPDNDEAVNPLNATDTGRTCKVCGTSIYYSGRGKPPVYCAEHKPKAGAASRSSGKSIDVLIDQMTQLYIGVSAGLKFVPQTAQDGMIIALNAQTLAESWRPLMERDPAIRKFWEKVCTGGGWGAVIMAHAMVGMAIANAHGFSLLGKDSSLKEGTNHE